MEKQFKKYILLFSLLAMTSSCNQNLLSAFGNTTSDAAIKYSAEMYLASGDWTNAINTFQKLSTTALTDPDTVADYASAYSGRCGLNFLNLASLIQNIGTTPIMQFLMKNLPASSALTYVDCETAEGLLKALANTSGVYPTQKGQFLMAFNSLVKIGEILSFYGDTNKDGIHDAGWDPCNSVTGPTAIAQADVSQIVTGLALFYQNVKGLSYASSVVTPMTTICNSINGTAADFCSQINPATVTAGQRHEVRAVIVETNDGVGLGIYAGTTAQAATNSAGHDCGN